MPPTEDMPKPLPLPSLLLVLLLARGAHSLRMINLDAPQIALQGDTIHLGCLFKLSSANKQQPIVGGPTTKLAGGQKQGQAEIRVPEDDDHGEELLYAIKWYKDGKEFYRYLAQEWPKKLLLPVDGVQLDVDKSDNHTIVLRSLALKSSGIYKCEVSTDAPHFTTKSIERRLLVYAIPNRGPSIEMTQPKRGKLFRGDSVELVCSSPESKPPLSLDWIINDTLNLSSVAKDGDTNSRPTDSGEAGRHFNLSSSRFVRLPSLLASPSSSVGPSEGRTGNHISRQPQTMPSQIFYLIQNGSVASPLLPQPIKMTAEAEPLGKPQAINLTGSLDRLAETSTTKLNFTLDTNLFLYLSRLAANQPQPASSRVAGAAARSRGTRQAASRLKSPGAALRIKCVARVMHLSMSDEIRLNVAADKSYNRGETPEKVARSRSSKAPIGNWSVYLITIAVSLLIRI